MSVVIYLTVSHLLTTVVCRFTKEKIAIAPNNASAWNYLRGVLATSNTPYESLLDFVLPYSEPHRSTLTSTEGGEDVVDLENPPPSQGADLPSPYAVEFLADIYEAKAGSELEKAIKVSKLKSHNVIASDHMPSSGDLWRMNWIRFERSESPQSQYHIS